MDREVIVSCSNDGSRYYITDAKCPRPEAEGCMCRGGVHDIATIYAGYERNKVAFGIPDIPASESVRMTWTTPLPRKDGRG